MDVTDAAAAMVVLQSVFHCGNVSMARSGIHDIAVADQINITASGLMIEAARCGGQRPASLYME